MSKKRPGTDSTGPRRSTGSKIAHAAGSAKATVTRTAKKVTKTVTKVTKRAVSKGKTTKSATGRAKKK